MSKTGKKGRKAPRSAREERAGVDDLTFLHLRVGWWSLLGFLTFGFALETLHGLKLGFYLDVSNSSRRLMWTLAHAHGTLLSVLNLAFAWSVQLTRAWNESARRLASRCFLGSLLLLPLGFVMGGVSLHGGDPGLGVLLVPPGAVLLFLGVLLTARACSRPTGGGKIDNQVPR